MDDLPDSSGRLGDPREMQFVAAGAALKSHDGFFSAS